MWSSRAAFNAVMTISEYPFDQSEPAASSAGANENSRPESAVADDGAIVSS